MKRPSYESPRLAERRQQVAEFYLQSWTQAAIGQKLGISQPTVSLDLAVVRREWRESSIRDFDAAQEMELRKLDRVEREAWAAWERSQQPLQSAVISGDGAGKQARKAVRNRHGDLRALDTILKCIAARRAMLGLDAPTRIAPVMPDGQQPFRLAVAHLSVGELRALKRLRDRALSLSPEQEDMPNDQSDQSDQSDGRVD